MSWKDWVVMTYQFVGGLCMFLGGVSNDCWDSGMKCSIPNWRPLKIWAGLVGIIVLNLIFELSKPKKKRKSYKKTLKRR